MGFFNEDPFEDIVREFFGGSPGRVSKSQKEVVSGEDEERNIDYVETPDRIFLVFELPGYVERDVSVEVKSNKINVVASKKNLNNLSPGMINKFSKDVEFSKALPSTIKNKKFESTFKNGVLEVKFKR